MEYIAEQNQILAKGFCALRLDLWLQKQAFKFYIKKRKKIHSTRSRVKHKSIKNTGKTFTVSKVEQNIQLNT